MYKILVLDAAHNLRWWEYGFSHYLMKRIHFLHNCTNSDFERIYEIERIEHLVFTLPIFWKCVKGETRMWG